MGYCAQKANVLLSLAAMEKVLVDQELASKQGRWGPPYAATREPKPLLRRKLKATMGILEIQATKKQGATVPTFPVLANNGAMSQFVGAFEIVSKLTGKVYKCRFSHMWNGIATRHSDTIDTKFFVDAEALSSTLHVGFVKFREKT
jgi:hypothetical protein